MSTHEDIESDQEQSGNSFISLKNILIILGSLSAIGVAVLATYRYTGTRNIGPVGAQETSNQPKRQPHQRHPKSSSVLQDENHGNDPNFVPIEGGLDIDYNELDQDFDHLNHPDRSNISRTSSTVSDPSDPSEIHDSSLMLFVHGGEIVAVDPSKLPQISAKSIFKWKSPYLADPQLTKDGKNVCFYWDATLNMAELGDQDVVKYTEITPSNFGFGGGFLLNKPDLQQLLYVANYVNCYGLSYFDLNTKESRGYFRLNDCPRDRAPRLLAQSNDGSKLLYGCNCKGGSVFLKDLTKPSIDDVQLFAFKESDKFIFSPDGQNLIKYDEIIGVCTIFSLNDPLTCYRSITVDGLKDRNIESISVSSDQKFLYICYCVSYLLGKHNLIRIDYAKALNIGIGAQEQAEIIDEWEFVMPDSSLYNPTYEEQIDQTNSYEEQSENIFNFHDSEDDRSNYGDSSDIDSQVSKEDEDDFKDDEDLGTEDLSEHNFMLFENDEKLFSIDLSDNALDNMEIQPLPIDGISYNIGSEDFEKDMETLQLSELEVDLDNLILPINHNFKLGKAQFSKNGKHVYLMTLLGICQYDLGSRLLKKIPLGNLAKSSKPFVLRNPNLDKIIYIYTNDTKQGHFVYYYDIETRAFTKTNKELKCYYEDVPYIIEHSSDGSKLLYQCNEGGRFYLKDLVNDEVPDKELYNLDSSSSSSLIFSANDRNVIQCNVHDKFCLMFNPLRENVTKFKVFQLDIQLNNVKAMKFSKCKTFLYILELNEHGEDGRDRYNLIKVNYAALVRLPAITNSDQPETIEGTVEIISLEAYNK